MPEFRLAPRAEIDIEDIWLYSFEQWSAHQADSYIDRLYGAFQKLANEAPRSGRARDELAPGYRSEFCQKHVIFFRNTDYGIAVIRVLGQTMDPGRHLSAV